MKPGARGFSLLENLVALSVVAIALAAAARAASQAVDTSAALGQRTLARWVAENRVAELRAMPATPPPGRRSGEARQGPYHFLWEQVVTATGDANWRTVEVAVLSADGQALAHLGAHLLARTTDAR
ncbi:MAG: type II secretion system protein GspI [Betaproteobacteria bacterium]|nr:MAG: type II secretion system protein GspI [Betaproteobacteria bacterium]